VRNLIAIVSVISFLALASTAVLYMQIVDSSNDLLVARALDKAGVYALAARSAPSDDGVLVLLAEQMRDDLVLAAAVYTVDGICLGPQDSCAVSEPKAARPCDGFAPGEDFATCPGPDLGGKGTLEAWYELRAASAAEPGPGPRTDATRVLRLLLDTSASRALPLASLMHAGIIGGLLVLLVLLTARQARTLAREQALHRTMEEQRRLAELGRLSSVLAHEIRNPLGAIKGFAQYAKEKLSVGSPMQEDMQTIVEESGRLERLVRSLLSYARPMNLRTSPRDLRDLVRQTAKIVEQSIQTADQTLILELGDDPLEVVVDSDEMTQALLNLMLNAVEALNGSAGQVSISTGFSGHRIAIYIDDNGVGVPPELRDRLFEPFVTGKSSGTGLGLAVAARIVKAHLGSIDISDRAGGGTRFAVRLPRSNVKEESK
jgi:signal transduction histidine kinase